MRVKLVFGGKFWNYSQHQQNFTSIFMKWWFHGTDVSAPFCKDGVRTERKWEQYMKTEWNPNESFKNETQRSFQTILIKIKYIFVAFISDQRQLIAYVGFPMHPKLNKMKWNRIIIEQKWSHVTMPFHKQTKIALCYCFLTLSICWELLYRLFINTPVLYRSNNNYENNGG